MSTLATEILGVKGGGLAVGDVADVTVLDPTLEWRVELAGLRSKSKNSPFLGWTMKGRALATIVGGRLVYELARLSAPPRSPPFSRPPTTRSSAAHPSP